jgi:CheY-like chemotaxis protein
MARPSLWSRYSNTRNIRATRRCNDGAHGLLAPQFSPCDLDNEGPRSAYRRRRKAVTVDDGQVSGYRVFICSDSLQALELVEKKSFDLIITDLMMAGATGMDVLRATRKCHPRAKVIITTGTPSSETLLEAKREGAYAYLRKPFQLKQFLSILKDAIEHTRMRDGYQYQGRSEKGAREVEGGVQEI